MDINQKKEQLSIAVVHAVATVAGFATAKPSVDDDSIDVQFIGTDGRRPRVEAQLKTTSSHWADDGLHYPLRIKNYDELRAEVLCPRILIVLRVPDDPDRWVDVADERLLVQHCAYWVSLRGEPDVANTETRTVLVPRANRFTPAALTAMMERVNQGQLP